MSVPPVRYKARVLQRFPNAKPMITSLWPDGTARHVAIVAGNQRLEMPSKGNTDWWDENAPRSYRDAWREAFYWCLKHPDERVQADLFTNPKERTKP